MTDNLKLIKKQSESDNTIIGDVRVTTWCGVVAVGGEGGSRVILT